MRGESIWSGHWTTLPILNFYPPLASNCPSLKYCPPSSSSSYGKHTFQVFSLTAAGDRSRIRLMTPRDPLPFFPCLAIHTQEKKGLELPPPEWKDRKWALVTKGMGQNTEERETERTMEDKGAKFSFLPSFLPLFLS